MKYRLKHMVEYGALRVAMAFLCLLPYRAALGVAWVLAWLTYHVVRFRVGTAHKRIREVFGDRFTASEVRHIAWRSMRNLFFSQVELMRVQRMTPQWIEKHMEYSTARRVSERDLKKGAVLALVHTGNWDLAGLAARHLGLPIFVIVGRQRNPLIDNLLNVWRRRTGILTIPRDDPRLTRMVLRRLKERKILAILTDLRARTPAVVVDFLGGKANLAGGMSLFAWQGNVPVYPVMITRKGWARHEWHVFDPVYADRSTDKKADWQRLSQHCMKIFEAHVRADPEQFFWFNKRWVLDPLDPEPTA